MKYVNLVISFILTLFIFGLVGCSSSTLEIRKVEKISEGIYKDDLRINIKKIYAWVNLMPGEKARFHITGSFELLEDLGKKQIRYHSYHEIGYLIPKYFIPDKSIYNFLKLREYEKFVILRFVSWNATHDVGQGGFSSEEKDKIVEYLSSRYKLFISSEAQAPQKYEKYLIKIPPDKIHHALAFSELVVSEGATMASEAGILGTPSIYVNSLRACNNEDQEKFGLVFNFISGKGVLDKIKELEKIPNKKFEFQKKRKQFLNKKIDLTSLLIWFTENYPESKRILINNYQNRFKI